MVTTMRNSMNALGTRNSNYGCGLQVITAHFPQSGRHCQPITASTPWGSHRVPESFQRQHSSQALRIKVSQDEEKAYLPFLTQTLGLSLTDGRGARLEDSKLLLQELSNKYCRCRKPYGLCGIYSTLPAKYENSHRQYINK